MPFLILLDLTSALSTGIPSLADDYAAAQHRRALEEEKLLERPGGPFELPYFASTPTSRKKQKQSRRPAGGSGFGGASKPDTKSSPSSTISIKSMSLAQKQLAAEMASAIRKDGVIRLPSVLSKESCARAREHVLGIQADVLERSRTDTHFDPMAYYGVEPGRTCRTDLLLPLDTVVQETLTEMLSSSSPLRHLFCELFPLNAPLYEVAAVITSDGSHRQTIHPDLPHRSFCPLYVVFCALQDVTPEMGPTTFLRGTQEKPLPTNEALDDTLRKADVVLSTLEAGDVVLFDARTLHCGNANQDPKNTRAIFNFSFRQPDSGPLGYEGSIRKGYENKLTLGDMLEVADSVGGWNAESGKTLESVYGTGIL